MGCRRGPLYGRDEAEALAERERWFGRDNDEKIALLLDSIGPCRRLVDIGCGWGQFLQAASEVVPEVWGVDESLERLRDTREACPTARTAACRADELDLPDGHFDAVVTSQMLHEVKLFGRTGEMERGLGEIHRVLAPGGRYLLLDHADAGEGEVTVELPPEQHVRLRYFRERYVFQSVEYEPTGGSAVRLGRRVLQDFLTKQWSFGSAMEPMEMEETHNVFTREEVEALARSAGFTIRSWVPFAEVEADLRRAGGRFAEGESWLRKFLLVADKEAT
jgi:ubiquinone/menaquinone biosynthesis C-methylase UbiE